MRNPFQITKSKIVSVVLESSDTKVFRLKSPRDFEFVSGQFDLAGIPGWGECSISVCSAPHEKNFFELAIRDVGMLTRKIHSLEAGDKLDVRGPFGNGFDMEVFKDKPLVLIGGGCGFIPLRPLINDFISDRLITPVLQIFYGCKNEETLLFKKEYAKWERQAELNIILEKPSKNWKGEKGMITDLFKTTKITNNSVAILVGPPVMYKFVLKELKNRKLKDENIFLSLERRIHCGGGACQHCAIGPYYVCKDGPVFSWAQLKDVPGAISRI